MKSVQHKRWYSHLAKNNPLTGSLIIAIDSWTKLHVLLHYTLHYSSWFILHKIRTALAALILIRDFSQTLTITNYKHHVIGRISSFWWAEQKRWWLNLNGCWIWMAATIHFITKVTMLMLSVMRHSASRGLLSSRIELWTYKHSNHSFNCDGRCIDSAC